MANRISLERVEEIVNFYECKVSNMIAILQDVQAEYKYLSEEVLEFIG